MSCSTGFTASSTCPPRRCEFAAAACSRASITRPRCGTGASPTCATKAASVMAEQSGTLRIAAIGDLHVKEERTPALRELFTEVSSTADVLVLCGDLTDVGKPREAEVLAEELRACTVPVVGVLGNHDYECGRVDDVRAILKGAGMRLLDGQSCEIDGVAFIGVKGFVGGFGRRMLAAFGEAVVQTFVAATMHEALRLENAMRMDKSE